MVAHFTHNPKIKSSNPNSGIGREKMVKVILEYASTSSTMVEDLTHSPKIKSSNLATGTVREKMANVLILRPLPFCKLV